MGRRSVVKTFTVENRLGERTIPESIGRRRKKRFRVEEAANID